MRVGLPVAPDQVAAAVHGSWCPKMCTFSCPVAAATGLDEAVPWSLHREVVDLAEGRSDPHHAWGRLRHCSGCLACQGACTYDQDVPAQVLAARAALVAAGEVPDDVAAALEHLEAGRLADGSTPADLPVMATDAATVVVVEPRMSAASLQAWHDVAQRAGASIRFARPEGVGHDVALALGRPDLAERAVAEWGRQVAGATTVVVDDEQVLGPLEQAVGATVRVVAACVWLDDQVASGALAPDRNRPLGTVTWHDPARLARVHGLVEPPRRLLGRLGAEIVEPEGHGLHTVDVGVAMAMDILAPEASFATTGRRARMLAATDARVVTSGAGCLDALRGAGLDVDDLIEVVAAHTLAP